MKLLLLWICRRNSGSSETIGDGGDGGRETITGAGGRGRMVHRAGSPPSSSPGIAHASAAPSGNVNITFWKFLKANLFRMVPVVPNQTITLKPPPQRVNTSCSLPMGGYNHMVSTTLLLSSSESEIMSFHGMWLDLNNDRGNSCGMPGNCNLETPHLVHLGWWKLDANIISEMILRSTKIMNWISSPVKNVYSLLTTTQICKGTCDKSQPIRGLDSFSLPNQKPQKCGVISTTQMCKVARMQ